MSPARRTSRNMRRGFPRVSGDEPDLIEGAGLSWEFSPRERG